MKNKQLILKCILHFSCRPFLSIQGEWCIWFFIISNVIIYFNHQHSTVVNKKTANFLPYSVYILGVLLAVSKYTAAGITGSCIDRQWLFMKLFLRQDKMYQTRQILLSKSYVIISFRQNTLKEMKNIFLAVLCSLII